MTEAAYLRLSKDRDQVLTKHRGYGIVSVQVNDLTFAIPLRSNLNHSNGLKTVLVGRQWNGLDYSKALLVNDDDLNKESFKPRTDAEYEKIQSSKEKVIKDFGAYVDGYIEAAKKNETNNHKFRFTTLQYFHDELGI